MAILETYWDFYVKRTELYATWIMRHFKLPVYSFLFMFAVIFDYILRILLNLNTNQSFKDFSKSFFIRSQNDFSHFNKNFFSIFKSLQNLYKSDISRSFHISYPSLKANISWDFLSFPYYRYKISLSCIDFFGIK